MVKKIKQSAYVQTYSKGKLELVLYSIIIALNTTFACVTKAGKFWDLIREIFTDSDLVEFGDRNKSQLILGFI